MTDTDRHETVVDLIGAWALDACSPEEDDLVRAHLDRCPACAREAHALREVAAVLGGDDLRPPAGTAGRVRAAAHGIRKPAAAAPAYAAPYAAQVAALDLTLAGLTPAEWRRVAAYGEWTVHDLLAHLAATDSLVAAGVGLAVQPPVEAGTSPVARTAAVLDRERRRPPEETRRSWRAQADALCGLLVRRPSLAAGQVRLERPTPVPDALVARAFETWVHGGDIAAVTGRPTVPPLPEHLYPMADLAARMLPHVLRRRVAAPAGRHVRLHLTGAGGGTWNVPLDPAGTMSSGPAAVLSVDTVEFCMLVGDRRDPARIRAGIRGDEALARDVLAAAPGLAVP
jgi:uncharacterized protein (TIGR03083 family)